MVDALFLKKMRASATRSAWVARQTVGEGMRLRLALVVALLGMALVAASQALEEFSFGQAELTFIGDFGLGAISLFGLLLAALLPAQLFTHAMEGRSAYCLLTRRVTRGEYLAGKALGIAGLLGGYVAGLAGLIALLLWHRAVQLEIAMEFGPRLAGAAVILWLKLSLVATMTLFIAVFSTSALFAGLIGIMVAVIGHLRPFLREGSALSWLRVWPNLALLDAEAAWSGAGGLAWGMFGYWAAYVALFALLSTYVFRQREF